MAVHTFIVNAGRRVEIKPNPMDCGEVLISIYTPAREQIACVSAPASTAGLIAQALEHEAQRADELEGAMYAALRAKSAGAGAAAVAVEG